MKYKILDFLTRSRDIIDIEDGKEYKRVTIRINHLGVRQRDIEKGLNIGTKKQYLIKEGQFILSGIDARNAAFGIVPKELDGAIVTNDFWAFNINSDLVDINYFYFLTKTPNFLDACRRSSLGTTNRQRLQKDVFFNQTFEIPSIEIQRKKLDRIQKLSAVMHQFESELEVLPLKQAKLRQTILQDAIRGKLAPHDPSNEPAEKLLEKIRAEKEKLIQQGKIRKVKSLPPISPDEIPFELPKSWAWARLLNATQYIIDCPHSTPHYLDNETGYYGIDTNCINNKGDIIRLRNLSKESYEQRIKRITPQLNDIIYSREGSIGLSTYIPDKAKICLGQRVMLIRATSFVLPQYLKLYITSSSYIDRLMKKNRGIGAKHINVSDIELSLLAIPPLNEQNRIIEKVDSLMRLCDEQEKNIAEAKENIERLKKAILREIFN